MEIKERILIAIVYLSQLINCIETTIIHGVSANDWTRHVVWINKYLSLDFSTIYHYPPLYHIFMIPSYLILRGMIFVLQPVFFTISFFTILYFVNKYENKYAVLITALTLGTSFCFLQYSHALMPQWLDYVLFPTAFILMKEKKYKLSAFCL